MMITWLRFRTPDVYKEDFQQAQGVIRLVPLGHTTRPIFQLFVCDNYGRDGDLTILSNHSIPVIRVCVLLPPATASSSCTTFLTNK